MITWYGKPKTHSAQPTFQKLFSKKLIPHFFARWDAKNIKFLYLGTGSFINFQDNAETKQGPAIKTIVTCDEAKDILNYSIPEIALQNENNSGTNDLQVADSILAESNELTASSFALEKHLESYIEKFWKDTAFGRDYDIFHNGCQFPTETGPLDILAHKKDRSEFLVLELKRDKTSDVAVAQTLRYMGYIKKTLATNDEKVKGCIIGSKEDQNLINAISMVPDISFYRYNLSFSLDKVDF